MSEDSLQDIRAATVMRRLAKLSTRIEQQGFLPWRAEAVVAYLLKEEEKDEPVQRDAPTV